MSKKLASLSIMTVAFALLLSVSGFSYAQSEHAGFYNEHGAMRVDRDLGAFHKNDSIQFGLDQAYTSARGTDRDADYRADHFVPNTYGLMGDYWYDSNN